MSDCITLPQRPCISVKSEERYRANRTADLDNAEQFTLVTATESTGALTLSDAKPNATVYVDTTNGEEVAIGKGATVFVVNPTQTPGIYWIEWECRTNVDNRLLHFRTYIEMV